MTRRTPKRKAGKPKSVTNQRGNETPRHQARGGKRGRPRKDEKPRQVARNTVEPALDPEVLQSLRGAKSADVMTIKRLVFLTQISEGYSIRAARETATLSRQTVRDWLANDEAFKAEYDDALAEGTELVEDWLRDDASIRGNFMAKIAILRARKPEVYGDKTKVDLNATIKPAPEFMDKFAAFTKALTDATAAQIAHSRAAQGIPMLPPAIDITPEPVPAEAAAEPPAVEPHP